MDPEKRILEKQISKTESDIPKKHWRIILLTLLLVGFVTVGFSLPKLWLIIALSVASFFVITNLYYVITDLRRLPKFLKQKKEVVLNGVVKVIEINIDRYIKIDNVNDEGNHFIVEYNGMLSLIGGQEFLGIKKLKNKIEHIEIMNSAKTEIYYDTVRKSGKDLDPYYIFKKGITDTFAESKMWENLTDRTPFLGKVDDLISFIEEDKK